MKITLNSINAVTGIITDDEPLRQGNVGANTLTAVFEGKSNLAYTATFNYTRSDDGRLKDIPMTPTANAGEYYYKFSNPWFFAVYGVTTLTVYLKNSSNEIVASGQITFPIEQTDFDDDPNITYSEYQALLDSISNRQIEYEPHNVRGYDTLVSAESDLSQLAFGQIIIVKTNPVKIYQVQENEELELFLAPLDSVGAYLPLAGGTMTGAISQPVAPLVDDDLANKKYVDDSVKVVADDIADIIDGDLTVHTAYHAEMDAIGRNLVDLAKTSDLTAESTTRYDNDNTLQYNIDVESQERIDADALKVDKTTTILGIPLDNNVLLGEFKTALGEAISGVSGLMSATDKSRLDALHDLLEEGSANDVVDSINEILAIFNNYPEGADFVTALAGKVEKVEGMQLTHNDYSDTEKDKVSQAYAHKSLTNNPHAVTFAQLGSKPTTLSGFGITDAYTKAYIDSLKDLNGWESELITSTPLVNSGTIALTTLQGFDCIKLFARNTSTGEIDTDSFDTSLGLVSGYVYKLFDNADITFTIGSPNCTFLTSAGYELSIIGQKYTPLTADKVAYGETSNVEAELDKITIPNYEEVTHTALQSEITATDLIEIKDDSGEIIRITGNTIPSEDIPTLKALGIKNDEGVLFSALTNEEIGLQLGIWEEQGYPSVVEKLVSKSDNLFNGTFKTISSLDSENLLINSDMLLDDNSDGVPNGFAIGTFASSSLSNGVWTLTADAQNDYAYSTTLNCLVGDTFYYYAYIKSDSGSVRIGSLNPVTLIYHSGSGGYELLSFVNTKTNTSLSCNIADNRASGWTPIEIDKMGIINITNLVSRGILPLGLSNAQYKEMIDNAIYDNVSLRESDYIAVEPSVDYKLVKVSENAVAHKVIEYTNDNQVVKVNSVSYTNGISNAIPMNALTRKIKLVSDLMNRVPNLVSNSDLLLDSDSDNIPDGFSLIYSNAVSLSNGVFSFLGISTGVPRLTYSVPPVVGQTYYGYTRFKTDAVNKVRFNFGNSPFYFHSGNGSFEFISGVYTATTAYSFSINDTRTSDWTPIEVDYIGAINITDFKEKGVKNDTGTLFSVLTNSEIKAQMDLWVVNGFPDHVINALYPNGADSAISFKYNGADDTYSPQQIDEVPLNLTLRSGEYWENGVIIKQNGNAEAYPLSSKIFSAWNYGQLDATYTSGFPMDFKVKYTQNTAGQVSVHSEYLKEARERLDTLRTNQEQLIKKLGLVEEEYDSYAGITSSEYEYFELEGVKEGNKLAIEGYGQSIQNLLGKSGTITASQVVRGVTVTYDSATGVFTANGTATAGTAFNITLATGMNFALPTGTSIQLMRYYDLVDGGTVNLNGSYIGYVLMGTSVSNRINENSEALYDPYINGSGALTPNHVTDKQKLLLQVWKEGIVFTNFKFKIGIYQGLQLRPFILPSEDSAKSSVSIYNKTANKLNIASTLSITNSGVTITYNPLLQEFLLSGTASATIDISLTATFNVLSGDRLSIKRQYQSGDITDAGGVLPRIKLIDGVTVVVYNDIYKMTAPEGVTPTPDISFNTGTASADGTVTLKLGITNGQVFSDYRFRLMVHDKSSDIGYVRYEKDYIGSMLLDADEKSVLTFNAIPFGILEFVSESNSLNLLFGDSISDLRYTILEYNAGIGSPNRKISVLDERATAIDEPFRDKVIAIWGDSRESNNPTSNPSGVGDQKDTSYPALLAKKLHATVLNFGLSGGAWAENTVQQDAGSAIVNRVLTEDSSASADVIIISSMNDFKLYTTLGSPLSTNKDKTTYYGAIRLTFDRLANKYPGKKIWVVLPQKRFDESTNYGGGDYLSYRKAQLDVCREYGIPTIDLYNNFPNSKTTAVSGGVTFYATNMLNDTHFSAVGNDLVAELITRALIGNGNSGVVEALPALPTTNGTYTLKLTVLNGVNTFSWVLDN